MRNTFPRFRALPRVSRAQVKKSLVSHLQHGCLAHDIDNDQAFWLQISGASLLSVPDIKNKSFGEASDKIYNDLNGAADIRKLIDENPSRATDQFLLNFVRAHSGKVRTALIFPPIIYGEGRGPGNTRSIQIPDLCKQAIEKKESVYVGKGEAIWGNVHITDLGSLAGYLVKASVDRQDEDDLFNENGLYFPATGGIVSGPTHSYIEGLY